MTTIDQALHSLVIEVPFHCHPMVVIHDTPAWRITDSLRILTMVCDAPRWRVMDDNHGVAVEWNFNNQAVQGLVDRGHPLKVSPRFDTDFGCAQLAMKTEGGYIAASDHRKDGYPVGL